jgi:hypothetical protein
VAAVRRMHAAGVVHLDIHPHNTLHRVLEDGRVEVLLIDFDAALLQSQVTPKEVIDHVQRGDWASAYPSFLEQGVPPSPLIDWYFVAAIVLSHCVGESACWRLPATKQRPALDSLFRVLEKHRKMLEGVSEWMKEGRLSEVLETFKRDGVFEEESLADDLVKRFNGLEIQAVT